LTEEERREVMEATAEDFEASTAQARDPQFIRDLARNWMTVKKIDFVKMWMKVRGISRATAYRQVDMMIAEGGFLTEVGTGLLTINFHKLGWTKEEVDKFWDEKLKKHKED